MTESIRISDLSISQRWLYAAHVLLACGTFALSIGSILRLVEDGELPHHPIFPGHRQGDAPHSTFGASRTRDFFNS